jgi:hypothetical protein
MKPLYDIASEYAFFVKEALECEELTAEQLSKLEDVQDDIENKAINVAAFIRNLESERDAIEEATENMVKRKISLDKKIDNIKVYLKDNLERCDIKKVKSPYYDITIKNNPPSIQILNESEIPEKYIKESILKRIDKTLISLDLKNQMHIPGIFVEKKTRLEIR